MTHRFSNNLLAILLGTLLVTAANAAVTPEEAAALKTTLTPVGAERAGNADGSIPEWTGGYQEEWPGYVSGDVRPDPFKDEKPLFSIDKSNLDQYADKLALVVQELIKRYPYRVDVYKTHRTARMPQWFYDNAFKNATRARTADGGIGLENAFGGTPFPIPKDGYEVLWNHLVRWAGVSTEETFRAYVVTRAGEPVVASESVFYRETGFNDPDGSLDTFDGSNLIAMVVTSGPPFKAGEAFLINDPVNQARYPRKSWQYLLGQRRVRRAPQISYDTPDFVTSGVENFDEAEGFNGSMDRYDVKLIGKREMIIPYNNNHFLQQSPEAVLGPHWLNPDHLRWELHRVWVVELTLKEGKRHVMPRRLFYIDEDSWYNVLGDQWDANNELWRMLFEIPFVAADLPGILARPFGSIDLQSQAYTTATLLNGLPKQIQVLPHRREKGFFTPANLGRLVTR